MRLNRTCFGKEDAFVLDFVNSAEDIRAAFAPYYEETTIEETTDANIVYELKSKLDELTTMALALPPILFLVTVRKCSTMICVFCAKLCGCRLRNLPRALFVLLFL